MEVRSVAAKLPQVFVSRDRVFGLWKTVRVEPWGCESREDDGEGV